MPLTVAEARRWYYSRRRDYRKLLSETDADPFAVVVRRRALSEMSAEIKRGSGTFLLHESVVDWETQLQTLIERNLDVRRRDPEALLSKLLEYRAFWRRMHEREFQIRSFRDPKEGVAYLSRPNKLTLQIIEQVGDQITDWFEFNVNRDPLLMRLDPAYGLLEVMKLRKDLAAAMRVAQRLPRDIETFAIEIDRPAWVETTSLVIGFIPFIGNAITAYEAYEGRDIFGYRLTDVERGIMTGAILLPFAGRFIRSGKSMYTASRMKRLYGATEDGWSSALAKAEDATSLPASMRSLDEAESIVRRGARVRQSLATDVDPMMARLSEPLTSTRAPQVSDLAYDILSQYSRRYKFLGDLDILAMQRLLDKGANAHHIKGQLLEEVLETKIVQWLRKPFGKHALGLEQVAEPLEFVPGHLVRDLDGRQLTDGIIGYTDADGVLQIVAVFEAKAGKAASRGLTSNSTSYSKLSNPEKHELRMVARETHEELKERATKAGTPFDLSVEDVEKKIILSERGGQVRKDIERLGQNASGAHTQIFIGAEERTVSISPVRTKVFGVLPRDVKPGKMEKTLKTLGYNFEVLPLDVTSRQLSGLSSKIVRSLQDAAKAVPQ